MTIDIVSNFPFFSIFLAMLTGILTAPVKKGRAAWWMCFITTSIVAVFSAVLLARLYTNAEAYPFMMGHFPAPWGNEIKAGPLEALMALLFSLVMLLALLGGRKNVFEDILPEKQNLYFIMLNLLFGAMIALIYTNDLFTAYVFIEISTIAACSIIMAKDTPRSLVATMRYLIMMLLASGLFLIGVIILYSITGHLLMENIAVSLAALVESGQYAEPLRIVVSLIIMALSIKSALFPFHTMLPGAHSVATPTSSAMLSGLVLKSFIILQIKLFYRVFTVELLSNLGITHVLFTFGVLAMIVCSVQALKESDIKRMIAYSSCAQIGYIYMGLGLAMTGGAVAACFHIVAHAVTKSMLFICAGGLVDASDDHSTDIRRLRGMAYRNKIAGVGFTVGALSMIGLPLLPGFVSKLYLGMAAIESTPVFIVVILSLLISMVLNAMYFVPAIIAIWTRTGAEEKEPAKKISLSFKVSVGVSVALNVLLGIFFQPILRIIELGLSLL